MGLVLDGLNIFLIMKSDRFCQVIDTAKSELSGVVKNAFNGVIDPGKVRFAVSLTPVRNCSALLLTL